MEIPVYLFTGFLESGKTTLIKDTLADPYFTNKETTLLIVCEEGMIEYEQSFLQQYHTTLYQIQAEEELTPALLRSLTKQEQYDRILVEWNGTYSFQNFLKHCMPSEWYVAQILTTVDASTFTSYIQNMKSFMYEQLFASEVIIFNRCSNAVKKLYLRNNVKAINKGAQLIYENIAGEIEQLEEDDFPYDLRLDEIEIQNNDYGLWYMDALEHPTRYEGKHIVVCGQIIESKVLGVNHGMVFGRYAMVCCQDDLSCLGFLTHVQHSETLQKGAWVKIKAQVEVELDSSMNRNIPVLYVIECEEINALEEEYVNFS